MKIAYSIALLALTITKSVVADELPVKIDKEASYFYVNDRGQKVKVMRIQDTGNRLTDDFTKTSRECPPYCIQPIEAAKGVRTIGEVELKKLVNEPNVLLIDARRNAFFVLEALPRAVNIPKEKSVDPKLLKSLGNKELIIYGNGPWSPEATEFIRNIVRLGYPAEKIRYYRDGLQGWKLLGFTTVIHKKQEVK